MQYNEISSDNPQKTTALWTLRTEYHNLKYLIKICIAHSHKEVPMLRIIFRSTLVCYRLVLLWIVMKIQRSFFPPTIIFFFVRKYWGFLWYKNADNCILNYGYLWLQCKNMPMHWFWKHSIEPCSISRTPTTTFCTSVSSLGTQNSSEAHFLLYLPWPLTNEHSSTFYCRKIQRVGQKISPVSLETVE